MKRFIPILNPSRGKDSVGCSRLMKDGSIFNVYEFTRDIVNRVADKLEIAGYTYRFLVQEVIDINPTERTRRANRIIDENEGYGFVVTIDVGERSEWEVCVSRTKKRSTEKAYAFCDCCKIAIEGARMRQKNEADDLLTSTKCPSFKTKNLSINTEEDCEYLASEDGREAIAEYHANAIIYLINNL